MSVSISADPVLEHVPAHSDSPWLADRREQARDRLRLHGFPAKRSEKWKGTDVAAFAQSWQPAAPQTLEGNDLSPFLFDGITHLAVLVDGHFSPALSHLDHLPHAVHVESLSGACARGGAVLDEHLDTTGPRDDAFANWNMTAWTDGLFVTTAEGVALESPLHILHVRTSQANTISFPRVLIHLRDNSEVQVIEHHASMGDAVMATVAVTELVAHPGARLRHDRIQEHWTQNLHAHSVYARADRDATIALGDASLGAGHGRLTVEGQLAGQGAHLALHGFFLAGGTRRADVWTRFDHAAPHTTSQELIKGVLGDSSRGRFTGNVLVRQVAQKTNAEQENRNLLLSNKALVDAQPQLEIHTDDVQCSHGSTVGQLDDDALFFLRARGIGLEDARLLLTQAFLGEAVRNMNPVLRDGLNRRIEAWFARHPQIVELAQ